jgi:undecaprenyl-diphosphatase
VKRGTTNTPRAPARRPALDASAVTLSHLGRGGLIWVTLAPVLAMRARAPVGSTWLRVATSVWGTMLTSTLLARLIDRPRPCAKAPAPALIDCPDGPSLPSDHAATSFAGAVVLGALCPELRAPLLGLASAISGSRVYVGVHYASDVSAGAILGGAIGALSARSMKRRA